MEYLRLTSRDDLPNNQTPVQSAGQSSSGEGGTGFEEGLMYIDWEARVRVGRAKIPPCLAGGGSRWGEYSSGSVLMYCNFIIGQSGKQVNLLGVVGQLEPEHAAALEVVLFARELHLLVAALLQLPAPPRVERGLSPAGRLAPGRGLDLQLLAIGLAELHLEPDGQAVGQGALGGTHAEALLQVVYLLVLHLQGVEVDELGGLADDQAGVHHPYHGLVGDPRLHGAHLDAVGFFPKLHLLIDEVLVPHERALVLDPGGDHKPLGLVSHVQVAGLDHAVQQPVVDQVVPHWLADDHVDLVAEVLEELDLDDCLEPILLDDFSHHVHILLLHLAVPVDHAVHLAGACLCGEDRVQAVAARRDVQHLAAVDVGLVLRDRFQVRAARQRVLERTLHRLQAQEVDLRQGLEDQILLALYLKHIKIIIGLSSPNQGMFNLSLLSHKSSSLKKEHCF